MDIKDQFKALRTLEVLPESEQRKLDIKSVKLGGFIELNNDIWKVINHYSYLDVKWANFAKRKKDYWMIELGLLSLTTGKKTCVEWKIDDELEISLTDSFIKIRDIQFNNKSLTRSDIDFIEDEEEGQVKINGAIYHYSDDDTWAGLFYKTEQDAKTKVNGSPLKVYEFESDKEEYLSIEMWHDKNEKAEREAYVSHSIKTTDIKVLQQ